MGDQLTSLRGQISEIKEHIDLLMMQSAIIRKRRSLLQQQQDVRLLAIKKRRDHLGPETSYINFLDMEESIRDSVVLAPPFTLKGADDLLASRPRSRSTVVRDSLCLAPSSLTRWVLLARPSLLINRSLFKHPRSLGAARPNCTPNQEDTSQDAMNSRACLHGMSLLLSAYSELCDCFDTKIYDTNGVGYEYIRLQTCFDAQVLRKARW
ncbi:hypothetical protein DFH29DRAFT_932587 [Suillus ampliporus]|nr:hypothetical protein DFH29DRAFT_932587 [Suillus ampliporus]